MTARFFLNLDVSTSCGENVNILHIIAAFVFGYKTHTKVIINVLTFDLYIRSMLILSVGREYERQTATNYKPIKHMI